MVIILLQPERMRIIDLYGNGYSAKLLERKFMYLLEIMFMFHCMFVIVGEGGGESRTSSEGDSGKETCSSR